MQKLLLIALAVILFASTASSDELSAADLDKRRKALADLLKDQWEYTLRTSPEFASILGDRRYNDQSSDNSEAAVKRDLAATKKFLQRLERIDTTGFSEQEAVNKALMAHNLRDNIENIGLNEWEMAVTQISGIHLFAAQLPSLLPFATTKDYDDYAKRLRNFPKQMDDTIANMRKGIRDRLMPPQFLLEKVVKQASGIAAQEPDKTPFAEPLAKFPDAVPEAERARLRTEIVDAIRTSVLPSYVKFAAFVRDDYAPHGRKDVGMWALPDGAKRYAARVRQSTTTKLSAAEIHQIGLNEVTRIEGEMLAIAKSLGFADLKSFRASLDTNPDLKAKSREDILQIYRGYIDQMYAKLPQLFGRLPKAKVIVAAVEEFREKEASGAQYEPGAPDGSRPGRVEVNTGAAQTRKTISMESTAYHEGVPGHHMQIAITQELTGLPEFRRFGTSYTAYVEGWALYSEKLGKEVGFYTNPYNDYGRLQDEMLRAIRLVVDTGLHSKRWTREQVVQFFHDHTSEDEVEVQSETDRYIVWPGQALGYKIGSLKITELRERARHELGDRFDIRAFHDEVLGAGALPMDVLEQRINDWIGRMKK
ncbi:MAG: hypothetical protein QOI58_4392 [Thermoanaerobaculia bacterium]|jgi:uncharacterized protein (DUF885 family)|nr:hypothetical protein [Thermoanaerobaculia bacterium]